MPYNATVVPGELATITPTMLLDPVVLATLSVCSYILLKDSLLRDTKPLLGAAEHPDEEEFAADKSKTMVSRMISGKKRVLVIYGSETGTSKAYANRFVREVRAHLGVGCLLCDPSKEAIEVRLPEMPLTARTWISSPTTASWSSLPPRLVKANLRAMHSCCSSYSRTRDSHFLPANPSEHSRT